MRRRFISNKKSFDYSQYMTVEALEHGVAVTMPRNVEYNMGNGWVALEKGVASPTLAKGQLISFKSQLLSGEFGTISISGYCFLRGNCMSLLGKATLHHSAFLLLFNACPIVGIEETFLPATTLADSCYAGMFSGCTSLTNAPKLSAKTLADSCYSNMFSGCTSLTNVSTLSATTLAYRCCYRMFYNCTSLTNAPVLSAIMLVSDCYYEMFRNCTKLDYIKMLATDISASNCLHFWVLGVSSTGDFYKNKNATWDETGPSGIPSGWYVSKIELR